MQRAQYVQNVFLLSYFVQYAILRSTCFLKWRIFQIWVYGEKYGTRLTYKDTCHLPEGFVAIHTNTDVKVEFVPHTGETSFVLSSEWEREKELLPQVQVWRLGSVRMKLNERTGPSKVQEWVEGKNNTENSSKIGSMCNFDFFCSFVENISLVST